MGCGSSKVPQLHACPSNWQRPVNVAIVGMSKSGKTGLMRLLMHSAPNYDRTPPDPLAELETENPLAESGEPMPAFMQQVRKSVASPTSGPWNAVAVVDRGDGSAAESPAARRQPSPGHSQLPVGEKAVAVRLFEFPGSDLSEVDGAKAPWNTIEGAIVVVDSTKPDCAEVATRMRVDLFALNGEREGGGYKTMPVAVVFSRMDKVASSKRGTVRQKCLTWGTAHPDSVTSIIRCNADPEADHDQDGEDDNLQLAQTLLSELVMVTRIA